MYYLSNFVIYSILGFIFESIVTLIWHGEIESGFMYGPYTIVYGIGVVLIFSLFRKFKKVEPEFKKLIYMFLSAFTVLTFTELLGAVCLKEIYGIEMWNYKGLPLNVGKYISIEISTIWAISSIIIYFYLKPLTDKQLIKKIPNIIIIGISLIMLLDFFITSINILI